MAHDYLVLRILHHVGIFKTLCGICKQKRNILKICVERWMLNVIPNYHIPQISYTADQGNCEEIPVKSNNLRFVLSSFQF